MSGATPTAAVGVDGESWRNVLSAAMVLCCDITSERTNDKTFVLLPNGLYVSQDESLAPLWATLTWCNCCSQFRPGEYIDSIDSIQQVIDELESGQLSDTWRFIYGDDKDKLRKAIASQKRRLQWRQLRKSPPKCLECGSTALRNFKSSNPSSLVDPGTGDGFTLSESFASTSIDHRLSLFTSEGDFRGEISRFDSHSNTFIDDSYSRSAVLALLESSLALSAPPRLRVNLSGKSS